MCVSPSELSLQTTQSEEIGRWVPSAVASCGQGTIHSTCVIVVVTTPTHGLTAYLLEASSTELAQTICAKIGKSFLLYSRFFNGFVFDVLASFTISRFLFSCFN